MAQMATYRLLFVRPRREATLAPIYAALSLLVFVSCIGIAVALWREPSAPAAKPAQGRAPAASNPFEGGLRRPPDAPKSPKRSTWM